MSAAPAHRRLRLLGALVALVACTLQACGGGAHDDDEAATAGRDGTDTRQALRSTGRELDIGIEGPALLVLQDEATGARHYSRDGRLSLDDRGRLVHVSGALLVGRPQSDADWAPLQADTLTLPPRATTRMRIEGTLEPLRESEAMPTWRDGSPLPQEIVDAQRIRRAVGTELRTLDGQPMHLLLSFVGLEHAEPGSGAPHRWLAEAVIYTVADGELGRARHTLQFLPSGAPDPAQDALLRIETRHAALAPVIELDLSALREAPGPFNVERIEHDGHGPGRLDGASIGPDGRLTLHYDNGLEIPGGQLALARFGRIETLEGTRLGNWQCSGGCQSPSIVAAGSGSGVALRAGWLNGHR